MARDDVLRVGFRTHGRTTITQRKRAAIFARDNWTCQYCGRTFQPGPEELSGRRAPVIVVRGLNEWIFLEIDHIHPLNLGGDNSLENLQAACSPCNRAKSDSTSQVDWVARIEIALRILAEGEPTMGTARRAAEALIGETVRMKKPRRK